MSVHVWAPYILLCQALFDAGRPETMSTVAGDADGNRVGFRVNGLAEPLEYMNIGDYEIAVLNLRLTLYEPRRWLCGRNLRQLRESANPPNAHDRPVYL